MENNGKRNGVNFICIANLKDYNIYKIDFVFKVIAIQESVDWGQKLVVELMSNFEPTRFDADVHWWWG